jgi:hypothetical protein
MGLKSGSRDSGLEDTEEDKEQSERDSSEAETVGEDLEEQDGSNMATESEAPEKTESAAASDSANGRPSMSSIPYKLRREKVNEGREQVPYFLREEIIDAEDELQSALEERLGEDVYKSDYREAAMVVAQRNPELVAKVLREWGYDLEAT